MLLSRLPAFVATAFLDLAHWLDRRSAVHLPLLLYGIPDILPGEVCFRGTPARQWPPLEGILHPCLVSRSPL
jgi:hypothetical protein